MSMFLHSLLSAGITAGWIVAVVLVLRLLFKRAPRWISVALWALVAVRLLIPISWESPVSIVPSTRVEQAVEAVVPSAPPLTAESGASHTPPVMSSPVPDTPNTSARPTAPSAWSLTAILTAAWGVGVLAMLLYAAISTACLYHHVRDSVRLEGRVYRGDRVPSPFVLGVFRPRIYLPRGLATEERLFVTAHEEAHIKRGDHLWKPLGFLLLSVYWFQPLLWVAYWCLCRDIEAACDERVVKVLSADERKQYSYTLVSLGHERRRIAVCPVAFGEVGLKERVKRVMSYKKPAVWIIAAAVLLTAVASVCLLTNRGTDSDTVVKSTFKGTNVVVSSGRTGRSSEMNAVVGDSVSFEDGTDTPVVFTVDEVDTKEMTITLSSSKALWRNGAKETRFVLPYDTEGVEVRADIVDGDCEAFTLKVDMPSYVPTHEVAGLYYPDQWEDDVRTYETVYRGDSMTITLYPHYFEATFGLLSDYVMKGRYTDDGQTLTLTEGGRMTEYVFRKEANGRLRFDEAASYRHDKAKTLTLTDGYTLDMAYRYVIERAKDENDSLWDEHRYTITGAAGTVIAEDTLSDCPTIKALSDDMLQVSVTTYENDISTKTEWFVDLQAKAKLPKYNTITMDDQNVYAVWYQAETTGVCYVELREYSVGCLLSPPLSSTALRRYRLLGVEDLAEADARVELNKHVLKVSYTDKVGKRHTDVYDWQADERITDETNA